MGMLRTKRWCDPVEPDDGFRVLIARYRPRGVSHAQETWSGFMPQLGPSKALHAAVYGKAGAVPIDWDTYAARYLEEMGEQTFWIHNLAALHARGETLTLLCSSACTDEARCHRSLLRGLIEAEAARLREAQPEARGRIVVGRGPRAHIPSRKPGPGGS
jgi:uncharacterized protein YeaO (DUF488 family)